MSDVKPWKTLSSEVAFETPDFKVRQDTCLLPDGTITKDNFFREEPDVAVVFCITKANEVVFVRQYRQAVGAVTLELPSGRKSRHDLTLEDTARRELQEETGYAAEVFARCGTWRISVRSTARVEVFFEAQADKVASSKLAPGESIEVVLVPLADVKGLIERGELTILTQVAAIYLALDRLARQPS